MPRLRIKDITVPDDRFREDAGDLEGLAQSLLLYGQLQPIVVEHSGDGANVLVAGFRRITAAGMNGWQEIDVVFRDEMDEWTRRAIELEENIQRHQMSWLEEQHAIAALHDIKLKQDPTWTQQRTAEVVGEGAQQSRVSEAIKLTKMVELFPEIAEAKTLRQAQSWMKQKAQSILRVRAIKDHAIDYSSINEKIILGDSIEVIKTMPDGFVDLVLTDPPFGIDYHKREAGISSTPTAYEDSAESYERILTMARDIYRVIKPDGWLIWFLGHTWYEQCKVVFRAAGFTVDEIPIMWDRSDGSTYSVRPDRYFARGYDIALHCLKGDPELVQRNTHNVIRIPPVPSNDREALVERPVELYQELIRRCTIPGEMVADFFVGTGSCLAAAASMGRDFVGVELSSDRRAIALNKVKAHLPDA